MSGNELFVPHKLRDPVTMVSVPDERTGTTYKVVLKFIRELSGNDRNMKLLLNNLMKRVQGTLEMVQVGRSFFDPHHPAPITQHRLEVWPGYVTAIKEVDGGLMMTCDVAHRVLRTDTVLDFMYQLQQNSRGDPFDAMRRELIGFSVLTRYNNKTYRVDDIDFNMSPNDSFTLHSTGESITYKEYYSKHYNKTIRDDRQPLLVHNAKPIRRKLPQKKGGPGARGADLLETETKTIYLVPELCFPTGLAESSKKDFQVMKSVANMTKVSPQDRINKLRQFLRSMQENPQAKAIIEAWGLKFDDTVIKTQGRILPREVICFGDDKRIEVEQNADWSQAATNSKVLVPVNLDNWKVFFVQKNMNEVNQFVERYMQNAKKMGFTVRQPGLVRLPNDRGDTYRSALQQEINPNVQLVVCVMPTARDDRYATVKRLVNVDNPVPSQVINARTIGDGRKLNSVVQKIALQINAKLGGPLWAVKIPLNNLMVCGMDSYHDKGKRGQSIGAFISSLDKTCTRWFSSVNHQEAGTEFIDCLKQSFYEGVRAYQQYSGSWPDRIIIYRDGVSDGQIRMVREYEIAQLKVLQSALMTITFDGPPPKLTMIIVQKRINTRLMAAGRDGGTAHLGRGPPRPGPSNPLPGAVLDHTATRLNNYDFFLVSQFTRDGTVSPTHYLTVFDESYDETKDKHLKADHIQRLTYKMTHMYYNWPGTVRVPAPCQYAHRLAFHVGQHLHKTPSKILNNRLYYL